MYFPGWGEPPGVQSKSEPAWGEPASPKSAVDNGTSAWGKPPGAVTGWGDSGHEPSGLYGRANGPSAPCKPGIFQSSNIFCIMSAYIYHITYNFGLCTHICLGIVPIYIFYSTVVLLTFKKKKKNNCSEYSV